LGIHEFVNQMLISVSGWQEQSGCGFGQTPMEFSGLFCMAHLDDTALIFAYRFQKQTHRFYQLGL
jgi:hypothetical protein